MKKILSFTFLLIVIATNASAQIQRNTDSTQRRVTNTNKKAQKLDMMRSLNLSKEQMAQLKELRKSQKEQRESIMNDQNIQAEIRKQKIRQLRREQNEKMKTILTPEQMEQLKEQRKNNMQQRRQGKTVQPNMLDNATDADSTK